MTGECYVGDCRDGLRAFAAAGIRAQTCVTSPPYWGLRDYGVAGQIGLEPDYRQWVAAMVEVFRLVRDVLADDGTLWLNLGDGYNAGTGAKRKAPATGVDVGGWNDAEIDGGARLNVVGLGAKQLIGMPWRVAFALQEDGWYLRSDIIWHKLNPMPESVTDRPTKAHEYLFLLTKRERYYYDAEAIKEPSTGRDAGNGFARPERISRDGRGNPEKWAAPADATRNKRTVWTLPTEPFRGAHFATFPRALVAPCILAGSRPGDVVIDPFMGSGTVAEVAQSLGRQWIGCELNPEYVAMQRGRTQAMGFAL